MVQSIFTNAQTVTIYRFGIALTPTYTSLKGAIANSMDNDSLVLSADTFRENNVVIDKSLSLNGTISATVKTIIDPGITSDSSLILFINPDFPISTTHLTIRDIDFTHGFAHNGFDSGGGALFAGQGTKVTIDGDCSFFNNTAADSSGVFEGSRNGGAIYSEGELKLRGKTKVFSNRAVNGAAIFAESLILEDNVHISRNIASNDGGGIYISSFGQILDSVIIDSNSAINGGGAFVKDALFSVNSQTIIKANMAEIAGGGLYLKNTYFTMKDSAVIAENSTDSNFAAAIYSGGNNDLVISGGQITGNYSTKSSVTGLGMALYNDSLTGTSSIIRINNARIFNPRLDNSRQNEFYNAQAVSAFLSDSTWWGESDTSALIYNAPTTTVAFRSWIVCEWTLNGGLPIDTTSSFPLEAYFKLYTGAAIPSNMFWMLQGYFTSDSGSFTPSVATMSSGNIVSSTYNVPSTTGGVYMNAVIDADSFKTSVFVKGTNIKKHLAHQNSVIVYPNPATNFITLQGLKPNTGAAQVRITNMLGKIVFTQNVQFTGLEILVPFNLMSGNYLLTLVQNERLLCKEKIIVQ